MGAMRVVVAAARVAAGEVVVGALVPILVPMVGLVQVAVLLLLLLVAVGAALLLLLAVGAALLLLVVGAALLLLPAVDGRGAALHLAAAGAENQHFHHMDAQGLEWAVVSTYNAWTTIVPCWELIGTWDEYMQPCLKQQISLSVLSLFPVQPNDLKSGASMTPLLPPCPPSPALSLFPVQPNDLKRDASLSL
ncbi:hypothetical protein EMCRGX_G007320 [Ephydatia muelleri]